MAQTNDLYRHTPLPANLDTWTLPIRVLRLYPAQVATSQLHGKLECVELKLLSEHVQETKLYEALSYAWGSSDKPCSLHIDGKMLPIGANLDSALRSLRGAHDCRSLWVDSVCIDQQNPDELTEQVAMMKSIYRRARKTIAWLGVPIKPGHDEAVLSFFCFVASLTLGTLLGLTSVETTDARVAAEKNTKGNALGLLVKNFNKQHPSSTNCLNAHDIVQFCNNPYFKRGWIVQEVAVSNRDCNETKVQFRLGRRWLLGKHLARAAIYLNRIECPVQDCAEFNGVILSLLDEVPMNRLLERLERYQSTECRDPRDRIAALLWHPHSKEIGVYRVDYRRSVAENYLRFAQCIEYDHAVLLCSAATRHYPGSMVEPTLPSWVPDWRVLPSLDTSSVRPLSADLNMLHDSPEAENVHACYVRAHHRAGYHRHGTAVARREAQYLYSFGLECPVSNVVVAKKPSSIVCEGDYIVDFRNDHSASHPPTSFHVWGLCGIVFRRTSHSPEVWRIVTALVMNHSPDEYLRTASPHLGSDGRPEYRSEFLIE